MMKTLLPDLCLQDRLNPGFFFDNRGRLGDLLTEDMSLDEVWKPDSELI